MCTRVIKMVLSILHLLLYLIYIMHPDMYRAAGGHADQPGAIPIAAIAIAAVVFVFLNLIIIAVIIWYIRSRSKNQKSTNKVCENNHTSNGDLQREYQQVERPQSYMQPFDTVRPKDSTQHTHTDNPSITESDRQWVFAESGIYVREKSLPSA